MTLPARARSHDRAIKRNVLVSALGVGARGFHLVSLFAIGRVFGADALGRFLLGFGLFEIVAAVVATGFTDGTMLFVSRRAGRRAGGDLVAVVATALRGGALVALALGAAATGLVMLFEGARAPVAALPGVTWLAWALLPTLVARVAFAATTGMLRPEWEALAGGAGPPLALLVALPFLHQAGAGVAGLFMAVFVVQLATALVAIGVLTRKLPGAGGGGLWRALRRAPLDRGLLAFALPQGLNMAANTYIARLDLFLLAAFGMPAAVVGGYGTIAALVLELRQIRMVVASALAPIVARCHAAGDQAAIARALARGARLVASVAVPVALGFALVHADVLALLAPACAGEPGFVLLLLVGPLINCLGGLAGNFLVYMLRNRWNLANSVLVALAQTGLGCVLIPRYGLLGAALSGTLALATVTLLENVEIALLVRVHIAPRALARAAIVLAVGMALVALALPLLGDATVSTRVLAAIVLAAGAAAAISPRRWRRPPPAPRPLGAAS